jgi:hypothetical protein
LLASLNHPNIAAIHGLEESGGTQFLVLELVEGGTLADQLKRGPIPAEESLKLALQIAEALEAAHEKGVIHRDLKPANIMATEKGLVKILDFGLAKLKEGVQHGESSTTQSMPPVTEQGTIVGTVAYMSPEQAEGKEIDARSDIFSFGSVLYEMVTGRRAFQGESTTSTLSAILRDMPTPVRKLRADVPAALERIVSRCLEKNRDVRYASAAEVWKELTAVQSQLAARRVGFSQILRRPRFAIPMLVLLAALAVAIGWFWVRSSRIRWARTVTLPEIVRLADAGRCCAALRLVRQSEPYLQDAPEFESIRKALTIRTTLRTDPPGADVHVRDYVDVADIAEWMHLGHTPLESVVIPNGYLAYRITKPDFDSVEGAASFNANSRFQIALRAKGTSPPGMIWIPPQYAGAVTVINTEPIRDLGLKGYWLDQYEVTNKQFKEFVDSGAYDKKEYWQTPFIKEGRVIPWEDALAAFRDVTGRPGPATWEFGTYPQDRANYPVSGVSWYEAVAYAAFAGKSLPTVHHWACAAGNWPNSIVLQMSNFAGKGPAPVGSYGGLSPYGIYDMAGNVKEWCWNPSGANRYILGGGME